MNENPEYIQVGVTALRDPITGDFLPAVPLYIRATPEARASEARLRQDMAHLFALRMKQYKEQTEREMARLRKERQARKGAKPDEDPLKRFDDIAGWDKPLALRPQDAAELPGD